MDSFNDASIPLSALRTANPPVPASHPDHAPARCAACEGKNAENLSDTSTYVYALGHVEARFPRLCVEKELAQATGSKQQTLYQALSHRDNRYLARQMWWVLTIQGLDAYLLIPQDGSDLDALVAAIERPNPTAISVVVGRRGVIAQPALGDGPMLPAVRLDQLYTFERNSLIEAIPRPEQISEADFRKASGELFDRIMQRADNAGATDEARALNYLSVRYSEIYARAAALAAANRFLGRIEARRCQLNGTRTLVDVVFSYLSTSSDLEEKYFVRCDVTEEFPFLVTQLSPYFDR